MDGSSISSWDVSTLTRFIRDILTNQPPQNLPTLLSEEIRVTKKLTVDDQVDFGIQRVYRYIGQVGQPAFANAWVNYGAPYDGAGFIKTVDNFIRLHGVIKLGTVGQVAFTLPPNFRPSTALTFPVLSNNAIGRLDIGTDGTVTPQTPSNNTWVSLDGVNFKNAISTQTS